MKKKILFLVLAVIFLVPLVIGVQFVISKMEESQLRAAIEEANYCNFDLDCMDAGGKCPFGCYNYVNKNEVERMSGLIEAHDSKCVYGCASLADVICENNKCKEVLE